MKSLENKNWEELAELLSRETDDEQELQDRCSGLNEEDRKIYQELNRIKLECDYKHAARIKNEVIETVYHKIFKELEQPKNSRNFHLLLSVAACALLLLSAGSLLFFRAEKQYTPQDSWIVFNSPNGVSNVVLPDSSIVTLNAGSTVSYSTNYNKALRQVKLEGEACFDVAGNKEKPFIVSTQQIDIKVLGTIFNVSSYAGDEEVVTSLLSGSVELINKMDKKIYQLTPNQSAIYNKGTTQVNLRPFDAEYAVAWIDGKLLFKKKAFSDICKALEKKFNCTIVVNNAEVRKKIFTGRFVNNETLPQILDVVRINIPFEYTILKNQITIN